MARIAVCHPSRRVHLRLQRGVRKKNSVSQKERFQSERFDGLTCWNLDFPRGVYTWRVRAARPGCQMWRYLPDYTPSTALQWSGSGGAPREHPRRAQSADHGRDNRVHARMMRLKMTAETLRSLARSVACWHYVTTGEDLEVMKKLHQEGVMAEMGEIALDLFNYLQAPGTYEDGVSEDEKARGVVDSIRSIFGIGPMEPPVAMLTPAGETMVIRPEDSQEAGPPDDEEGEESDKDDRYPTISQEDWPARERARKLLRNILSRQAEACEAQRRALLKESLAGPSPYELAAEIAPSHADALLMRRTQDANMREVRRLINLLLRIKRYERQMEALGEKAALQDIPEMKGVSSLESECPKDLSHSNENS